MTLTVFDKVDQGTSEWHDLRRGIVTASVVGKLVSTGSPDAGTIGCPTCDAKPGEPCLSKTTKTPTPIKTFHYARNSKAEGLPPIYGVADNDTARDLTALLAAERITGHTESTPMTSDMWRGVDAEPLARDIYSGHYQQAVEVGFMRRDEDDWTLGYSPDGLVADEGLIEIKAPRSKNQLKTILSGQVPAYYMPQLQAGLLVSGRKWIDFVSFFGGMRLYVKRVLPDPAWHEAIVAACQQFETTAAEMVAAYEQATHNMPATERIPDYAEIVI